MIVLYQKYQTHTHTYMSRFFTMLKLRALELFLAKGNLSDQNIYCDNYDIYYDSQLTLNPLQNY